MTALRVFMVSSDAQIAYGLAKLLQQRELGCCVFYASTQAQAMRWLEDHPHDWDVMIADTDLQEGSGLGLLAQRLSPHSQQKIVMLSYLLTEKLQVYCRTLGADLTLDKTCGFDLLMDKMALWSRQSGKLLPRQTEAPGLDLALGQRDMAFG